MKKTFLIFTLAIIFLSSCNNGDKKPYGAINIEYEKVEEYNKEGPTIAETHDENVPPTANRNMFIKENGPEIDEGLELVEPTADMDLEPDYGGIPVVTKGNN